MINLGNREFHISNRKFEMSSCEIQVFIQSKLLEKDRQLAS